MSIRYFSIIETYTEANTTSATSYLEYNNYGYVERINDTDRYLCITKVPLINNLGDVQALLLNVPQDSTKPFDFDGFRDFELLLACSKIWDNYLNKGSVKRKPLNIQW